MSNDLDIGTKLMRELVENHHCHTVILYGSRARGDFNENSDVDVLGIRDSGDAYRIGRPWNGYLLDVFVYAEENLPTPDDLFSNSKWRCPYGTR
jgi:predicted nucleotidyltransferase